MDSETTTLTAEVLVKEAKKLEAQGLEKNKIALSCASNLEQLLNEVFISRSPKQIDYDNRTDLVRCFNAMVKETFGNHNGSPIVEGFGSFVMGMFSADSDLDLSINFEDNAAGIPRLKKIQILRKLAKKLYFIQRGGHVSGIQTILTARVPIIKVIDHGTKIECDVSVENSDGIEKSLIIRAISTIDERFQKLSFLIKAWAKAQDINSSKERTLNSLSLVLLVAFHLQTRDPPILPPFYALLKDGNDPAAVVKLVKNYLNYGKRNSESLAELFLTLLVKLASVERLWQKGLCVSLCEGSWISKAWDPTMSDSIMSVEDFTDQSQNVSRAVGKEGFEKINCCIRRSLHYLEAFSNGQMEESKLKELFFGRDSTGDSVATNLVKTTNKIYVPNNPNQTKKTQLTENLEAENQSKTQPVHHETLQTKKRHSTEDLDKSKGKKRRKGAQPLNKKGGVQFKEVGKKQLVDKGLKPLPTGGWEGKHPVDDQRVWKTFGENSGHLATHFTPQVPHLIPSSQSLDSFRCQHPVFFPSISAPNFTGFQWFYNPIQPHPLVSLLNSLGLNLSNFLNPPAPMPHIGPINGQHAQHQPHTARRRPRE